MRASLYSLIQPMGRPKGSKNKKPKAEKVWLNCKWCRGRFWVYPSRFRQHSGSGQYCSHQCSVEATVDLRKRCGEKHHAWKGGSGSYRERALRHYGAQCQKCGYKKYKKLLWVHHTNCKPRNEQDEHELAKLRVLCIRCHLEEHLETHGTLTPTQAKLLHGGIADAVQVSGPASLDVRR